MNKKMILSVTLVLLLIIVAGGIYYSRQTPKVCFGNNCFSVEIADSPQELMTGLMNREILEENKGMLFMFKEESLQSFWMKDTLIPLDMIWMDGNKKIVYIAKNAQPCGQECNGINPGEKAKYVLEVNGGLCEKLGISLGDTADMTF